MQAVEWETEDQHSYDRLMVALEASQGKLDLLMDSLMALKPKN